MDRADPGLDVPADFRRQPSRLSVAVGLLVTAIGSLLPWVEGRTGFGAPVSMNGLVGSADGGFLLIFGLGLAGVALTRPLAEARMAVVRVAPLALAGALVATTITGHLNAGTEIRGLEAEGGQGAIGPGLWVATAGALLMALAAAWLTAWDRLRRGPFFAPDELAAALGRRNLVPLVGGLVGTLVGFAGVLALGSRALDPGLVLVLLVAAIVGSILGGWLGYQLGRWLVVTPPEGRR